MIENKDRYEGMWMNDEKEGPGKFIYKTRGQCYEGEWSKGLPKCGVLCDLALRPGSRGLPVPEVKALSTCED